MNSIKQLASRHPTVFTLLGMAFVVDIIFLLMTGSLRRDASYAADNGILTTYSTFAAGSVLAVIYFLGASCLLRFTLARRRINLGLAWLAIIVMFLAWFVIQTALQNGQYKPSFLFILCLVAAFKTMRFEDESQAEDSRDQACDAVSSPLDSEIFSLPEPSKESAVATAATTSDLPETTTPFKTGMFSADQEPSDDAQSKKNGLLNLTKTLAALASFGCLLALFEMPEDYYKVLRFAVLAACIAVIWSTQKSGESEKRKTVVSILFGLLAVIFNPILPLEMEREAWAWFDVLGALMLAGSLLSHNAILEWWKTNGKAAAILASVVILIIGGGMGAIWIFREIEALAKERQSKFYKYKIANHMIANSEVRQILTDLPKSQPEVQEEMRQKLRVWREGQRIYAEEKLASVFLDPEKWGGQWTPEHQTMVDQSLSPRAAKASAANLKWIAAQEGKSTDDIADFLPAYRKAYAQKFFKKQDLNDEAFYGAVQAKYQAENATK